MAQRKVTGARQTPLVLSGPEPRSPAPPATMRYMRPDSSGIVAGWNPVLRSQREDVRDAWRGASARTVDASQNSGWIAGAIDQMIADINGPDGLTIDVTPDAQALGWSADFTHAWSEDVERRFCAWANDPMECDARGKMTVADMADSAVRWYMPFGEALARILLRERAGATTLTKIQMTSPVRLTQETSEFKNLYQGVFLDDDGKAVGYRLRTRANGFYQDLDYPARDPDGRPLVIHVFDGDPDQTRGISPFAPALKVARQHDQLADATLTTALLQTIFAATFQSRQLPAEALEGLLEAGDLGAGHGGQVDPTSAGGMAALMSARADWYGASAIDLGIHGRITTAFPGDELKFHTANHPGGNYLPFSDNLLREMARCIGTTPEKFTGNYANTTYSSNKMGIASTWPVVVRRRRVIPVPLLRGIYSGWLEEQIGRGLIAFPGGFSRFLKMRAFVVKTNWTGPAKPSPDELKTASAMEKLKNMGIMSITRISSELGIDAEAEQQQRAQDKRRAERLGLPDPYAPMPGTPDAKVDPNPDPPLPEDT